MFPYNRIIVWAAGPISILAGWIATQLVQHVGIFGPLGLGQDKIAHAIVVAVTFAVSALVTYAAHHKWLDNLVKLAEGGGSAPAPVSAPAAPAAPAAEAPAADVVKPESAVKPDAPEPSTPAAPLVAVPPAPVPPQPPAA